MMYTKIKQIWGIPRALLHADRFLLSINNALSRT